MRAHRAPCTLSRARSTLDLSVRPTHEPAITTSDPSRAALDDITAAFRRDLLAFFDAHARDLPWRRTSDPYAIWVSEVMLQQTRVETVVPYFLRWMERFPDIETLAGVAEDEVLAAWEGLGYYRRARRLHRGAAAVRERFAGELPGDPELLRGIPGIGAYTAGAVASIAFGVPAPAVDGNVRRVLSRIFDLPDPADSELRELARELVDPDRPGDFNQALMELGATVCTPRTPGCGACPVRGSCLARARGVQAERPLRKARKAVPAIDVAVAVVVREAGSGEGIHPWRVAMVQRPAEGLLAGLWEFPGMVLAPGDRSAVTARSVAEAAGRAVTTPDGAAPADPDARTLEPVKHAYSHLRATYHPVLFRLPRVDAADSPRPALASPVAYPTGGAAPPPAREPDWVSSDELSRRVLPRAQRRIAEQALVILSGWPGR